MTTNGTTNIACGVCDSDIGLPKILLRVGVCAGCF